MPLVPVHMTARTTVLTLVSTHNPTQCIILLIIFAIVYISLFKHGMFLDNIYFIAIRIIEQQQ